MRLKREGKPVLTIKAGLYSVKQPQYGPFNDSFRLQNDCHLAKAHTALD